MRRILRLLVLAFAFLFVAAALLLTGFAGAAMLRETLPAGGGPDETAQLVEVEELSLHYRKWGPDDGPPVLLVHGTLAWAETWRDIAAPLGEAGYRVIAPDLPPFGYSQRPADGDYSRYSQARLLTGFIEAMDLRDFILVGHSFGGGATVEAALSMPERIEALVLLDVALGLSAAKPSPLIEALLQIRPARAAIAAVSFANPMLTPIGLRSFVRDPAVVTEDRIVLYRAPLAVEGTSAAIGDWMRTGLFGDHSSAASMQRDRLAALPIPTLVLWGREDTVTPLAQGEEIAALLPNARLVVLEGVNHIPHIEQPRKVLAALLSFIAEHLTEDVSGLRP